MIITSEHCTFIDKDLEGIDPHDPTLSKEIKTKIIEECKENIFYFLAMNTGCKYTKSEMNMILNFQKEISELEFAGIRSIHNRWGCCGK